MLEITNSIFVSIYLGVLVYSVMMLQWSLLYRNKLSIQQMIRQIAVIFAGLGTPIICFLTWDYFYYDRHSFDTVSGLIISLCSIELSAAVHWSYIAKSGSK